MKYLKRLKRFITRYFFEIDYDGLEREILKEYNACDDTKEQYMLLLEYGLLLELRDAFYQPHVHRRTK